MPARLHCVIRPSLYPRLLPPSRLSHLSHLSLSRSRLSRLSRPLPPLQLPRTMSSDAAYAAFLDKANEDANASTSKKEEKEDASFIKSKRLDVDERQIPPSLRVDAFYSSETDEPFEPVVLTCDHWPDEEEFSRLVHGSSSTETTVSVLSPTRFDSQGQYAGVVKAVQDAGDGSQGEVRVYRVQHGATRVEYWLLTLEKKNKLVGLKARAVES